MVPGTPFARCARCNAVVGGMRDSDARAGGWIAVLASTCSCGAPAENLVPATQYDALSTTPKGAALAIVLVPDDWPGG
jgi:hypothetical protein